MRPLGRMYRPPIALVAARCVLRDASPCQRLRTCHCARFVMFMLELQPLRVCPLRPPFGWGGQVGAHSWADDLTFVAPMSDPAHIFVRASDVLPQPVVTSMTEAVRGLRDAGDSTESARCADVIAALVFTNGKPPGRCKG